MHISASFDKSLDPTEKQHALINTEFVHTVQQYIMDDFLMKKLNMLSSEKNNLFLSIQSFLAKLGLLFILPSSPEVFPGLLRYLRCPNALCPTH
jgi:hypothetical protein